MTHPSVHSLHPPHPRVYKTSSPVKGRPIPGLMQHRDLLLIDLLHHAATHAPHTEIISRLPEHPPTAPSHRETYSQMSSRVNQLANVLVHHLDIKMGDVVGTLAFNSHRHMELYFAVSGIGAILHTINPRLYLEQLKFIIEHAEDTVIFVDYACVAILEKLRQEYSIPCNRFVIMVDEAHMQQNPLNGLCYETLLSHQSPSFIWPRFDENSASALCYTSGTTGNPKGVLYSHRSAVLHALVCSLNGAMGFSVADSILLIVPLFHAQGWGVPYAATLMGIKLVFPGSWLDGDSICRLMREERCTVSLGVPTVWLGMFKHLDEHPENQPKDLKRILIGGSAPPRSMIERLGDMGIQPINGYGMTEGSPAMSICQLLPHHSSLFPNAQTDILVKQGQVLPLLEYRLTDESGQEVVHDGQHSGELEARGNWISRGYYKVRSDGKTAASRWSDQYSVGEDGWFRTGDVSTIDSEGYMQIVDRSKDVIKSGGEWVSSVELENTAMGDPAIAEAAVIGVHHSKWQERPLLICVRKKGKEVSEPEVLNYLRGKVAKWWVPEGVEFVEELPHTATGKLQKTELRKRFEGYRFRTDQGEGGRVEKIKAKL